LAQRRRPGPGQADDKNGAAHHLHVDFGVQGVGVLDLESLDQGVTDRGVLDDLTNIVEVSFGIQRLHSALEALPVVGRTEVIEAGCGSGAVFQFVGRERHNANLSCTARRRLSRTVARSKVLTFLVSAGSADAMSSNATT